MLPKAKNRLVPFPMKRSIGTIIISDYWIYEQKKVLIVNNKAAQSFIKIESELG